MNRRGFETLTEVLYVWCCNTGGCLIKKIQDILRIVTLSVGDHRTFNYSHIHYTYVVFKLPYLNCYFVGWHCNFRIWILLSERQSGNASSRLDLTHSPNGLLSVTIFDAFTHLTKETLRIFYILYLLDIWLYLHNMTIYCFYKRIQKDGTFERVQSA